MPTLPPTVTAVESVCGNTAALLKYSTLVTDVHASVLANVSKACILAVSSALPKFKPVTVTDPLPLSPIFTPPDDMTGPTYSKIGQPATPAGLLRRKRAHHQR